MAPKQAHGENNAVLLIILVLQIIRSKMSTSISHARYFYFLADCTACKENSTFQPFKPSISLKIINRNSTALLAFIYSQIRLVQEIIWALEAVTVKNLICYSFGFTSKPFFCSVVIPRDTENFYGGSIVIKIWPQNQVSKLKLRAISLLSLLIRSMNISR